MTASIVLNKDGQPLCCTSLLQSRPASTLKSQTMESDAGHGRRWVCEVFVSVWGDRVWGAPMPAVRAPGDIDA